MRPIDDASARNILIATVVLAYATMGACLAFSKVSVNFEGLKDFYTVIAILLVLSAFVARLHGERLSTLLNVAGACALLVVPIGVWSYAAMSVAAPLADQELAALDRALGFDWRAYIDAVDRRPVLAAALGYAYNSFVIQLFGIPFYYALAGDRRQAYAVLFGYALLCLISSAISVGYPAFGTYATYGVGLHDVANINAKYAYFSLDEFRAVRDAAAFTLDFDRAAGILTFPSVHAGVAGLCAWAAWRSRVLRAPLLLLNVAMAASAISHANHYLVDVIAGLGIAGLTAVATTVVFYRPRAFASPVVKALAWVAPARRSAARVSET